MFLLGHLNKWTRGVNDKPQPGVDLRKDCLLPTKWGSQSQENPQQCRCQPWCVGCSEDPTEIIHKDKSAVHFREQCIGDTSTRCSWKPSAIAPTGAVWLVLPVLPPLLPSPSRPLWSSYGSWWVSPLLPEGHWWCTWSEWNQSHLCCKTCTGDAGEHHSPGPGIVVLGCPIWLKIPSQVGDARTGLRSESGLEGPGPGVAITDGCVWIISFAALTTWNSFIAAKPELAAVKPLWSASNPSSLDPCWWATWAESQRSARSSTVT